MTARCARPARRTGLLPAVVATAALALAGCGAPGSTTPATIAPTQVPYGLLEPPVDPLAAGAAEGGVPDLRPMTPVFLLGADGVSLQPSMTPVTGVGPEEVAEQALLRLEEGPTDQERSEGLGSALGPEVGLSLQEVEDGTARVELELTATEIAADRVPLAVGQVVLTLTAIEGVERVQVVSDGEPVEMALPGGKLTTDPVTASDYLTLTPTADG